jgi:hypothetical protein
MTSQEKELLARFLDLLVGARAGQKDAEAQTLIAQAVARQPDAAYLLVQRALQLEQLLQSSQEQVRSLQSELDRTRSGSSSGGSFLNDPNAWGSRPAAQQPNAEQSVAQRSVSGQPLSNPQPLGQPATAPQAPIARAAPGGSWSSGLFGNIASTAAGVVAGSFLFQGIQGLMHRGDNQSLAIQSAWPNDHTNKFDDANTPDRAPQDEPELLNSYFTSDSPDDGDSSLLADQDDSSDFV